LDIVILCLYILSSYFSKRSPP